jgi:hypothetical protein
MLKEEQGRCKHTLNPDCCALVGIWSTEEIRLAIEEEGFIILEIFELWSFDFPTFLFSKYINNQITVNPSSWHKKGIC